MTNTLEPRKKIRALRTIIYKVNRRKANDILREIQAECAALEIQVEELKLANENLLMENVGVVELMDALTELMRKWDALERIESSDMEVLRAALAAPDIEVPF